MHQSNLSESSDTVSSCSRADAIANGVLVDVSEMAKEAGFSCPVALTAAAWDNCVAWDKADSERQVHQDEEGRLWDVLYMCLQTAKHVKTNSVLHFVFYRVPRGGRGRKARLTRLKACVGPGDKGEPVNTIMEPNEE